MTEENSKGQHDTTRLRREMEARRQELLKSVEDSRKKLKGLLRPPGDAKGEKTSD